MSQVGKVYLVGVGPGDPELLTRKAERILKSVDVVVYDRLGGEAVLELVPQGTARIYVGKTSGRHTMPQEEISHLLVQVARSGRSVARLKGGDPVVFGRGGEEALALAHAAIPFEVVPGVTAALACAASTQLPVTHRGTSQILHFVTGHGEADGDPPINWRALVESGGTIAIYMGVGRIGLLQQHLLEAGMPCTAPVRIVANGTMPGERVVRSQLADLEQDVDRHAIVAPAILYVGEVVTIGDQIAGAQQQAGADRVQA